MASSFKRLNVMQGFEPATFFEHSLSIKHASNASKVFIGKISATAGTG